MENNLLNQAIFPLFSVNTDGISPFAGSKRTLWPIFIVINELSIVARFKFKNTILAGIRRYNASQIR